MGENLLGGQGTNYSNTIYGNAVRSALGIGPSNNAYDTRWDSLSRGDDIQSALGVQARSGGRSSVLNGSKTNEWDNALGYGKVGLGIGQLGLGLAQYFEDKKTAKTQRELMEQQLDTNKWLLDQQKSRQANFSKSFGAPATPTRV